MECALAAAYGLEAEDHDLDEEANLDGFGADNPVEDDEDQAFHEDQHVVVHQGDLAEDHVLDTQHTGVLD